MSIHQSRVFSISVNYEIRQITGMLLRKNKISLQRKNSSKNLSFILLSYKTAIPGKKWGERESRNRQNLKSTPLLNGVCATLMVGLDDLRNFPALMILLHLYFE